MDQAWVAFRPARKSNEKFEIRKTHKVAKTHSASSPVLSGLSRFKKIISNKRTFPEVFSEVLYNKEVSENSLSEIELIRNKVAHNRFISDSELTVLEGAWSKISGSMGVENIQEARTSASDRVPIVQTLRESLLILLNSKNLVEKGAAIDPKSLEPLKRLNVWWFDSEFLAEDVNVVEVYIKKLFEYAEIPRGFGQALTRRNWAQENSIAQIAHAALAKIEEMCRSAENTYA